MKNPQMMAQNKILKKWNPYKLNDRNFKKETDF